MANDNNHSGGNAMTETTTTIPAGFTKGSGKKFVEAAETHGWEYSPVDNQYAQQMRFMFTDRFQITTDREVNYTVTTMYVAVSPNGAYQYLSDARNNLGELVYRVDDNTVSDVLALFGRPAHILAAAAAAAEAEAKHNRQQVLAAYAKEAFLNSDEFAADRWMRSRLQSMVDEFNPEATISTARAWRSSVVSDAETFIANSYAAEFARITLQVEGEVKEWSEDGEQVLAVYTLRDAARYVLLQSIDSSDATDHRTAVAYAKAQREIARFV